ncbi:MAG TPA: 3-keto-5-aminohexanoate cleavage protein [Gammaproteobacteria bacterium]|nr:3-keto-5-aminohexanoate cleavage protein [Gammaproteobacteria bacterium]
MAQEVIVTCAVTGSHQNFHNHPDFPVTPQQIANSCLEARSAGAAVVHIHVRDPETGAASGDPALYREVVERIRDSGSDVLINLTTGEGGRFAPDEDDPTRGGPGTTLRRPELRVRHVLDMRPDICSLDVGTANFNEHVFMNTPGHLRVMADAIRGAGVKPEMEVFELGHIRFARRLIEEGHIEPPPMFQICLGIPWAAPATPEVMTLMRNQLPEGAVWAAFGISRWEFPMVAQAVTLGGHVRVGLEDNLYLSRGEYATNAALVEKAVRIIRELGAEPVEPARASELIELSPTTRPAPV